MCLVSGLTGELSSVIAIGEMPVECWLADNVATKLPYNDSFSLTLRVLNADNWCTVWVKKNPPLGDLTFFIFSTNGWEFLIDFLHAYYTFICTLDHKFFQLSPTLTKLCHIKRDYPVHIICSKCPPSAEMHAFRRLRKSLIALLIVVCGKLLYSQ